MQLVCLGDGAGPMPEPSSRVSVAVQHLGILPVSSSPQAIAQAMHVVSNGGGESDGVTGGSTGTGAGVAAAGVSTAEGNLEDQRSNSVASSSAEGSGGTEGPRAVASDAEDEEEEEEEDKEEGAPADLLERKAVFSPRGR